MDVLKIQNWTNIVQFDWKFSGSAIYFWTHLSVDSVLWSSVSVISISYISDFWCFSLVFDFLWFCIYRIFSYFCTLGELRFLDGGFLDLVVFGFRFWNLKPSYKFLNKSNYPLPLPLRIKIVCPDFTISTHYTSCFTIAYQGSTNRNVESRLTFRPSNYREFVRQFCPAIFLTK